ncbi:MAG: hypothetical protein QF793_01045 [Candidatus Peribacteraceae bacterium]|jgi:hypothetical protein|nr:hypothetical protein [bacterium]MDP6561491.1 hypothetical protein [Candidatus Peribacteraceae bacterium]|tara:strand:- start:20571 stop:21896 length:1326 start_codon:yes stop_codon:yes gene_type:complete
MILITLLLTAEGWLVAHRLLRKSYGSLLEIFLGLPLGALINLFAIVIITLIGIELHAISIIAANLVATLLLLISVQPLMKSKSPDAVVEGSPIKVPRMVAVLSGFIVAASLLYAVSHTLLPTFHYDSTTNWNMRSKVSYYRAEMVFDTQSELVSKPHYPFLYHALQISSNQFSPNWSDKNANGIHLLLMLACFGAIFQMLSRRGGSYALLITALIIGIPLMTLHAGQSYADITLIGFALVSLSTFIGFRKSDDTRLLFLSGLFLAACVWTKSDGLFFCYIPWIIMMAIALIRYEGSISRLRYPVGFSIMLSLTWPAFAALKGLSLTPHGAGDTEFVFNVEAVSAFSRALFVTGSFGIYWYGLLSILALTLLGIRKNSITIDRKYLITLLWGLIAMGGYMGVYLLTSNTEYLIVGQSFDRQILLPASLLALSLAYTLIPRRL